jgi:hypothetical protein
MMMRLQIHMFFTFFKIFGRSSIGKIKQLNILDMTVQEEDKQEVLKIKRL